MKNSNYVSLLFLCLSVPFSTFAEERENSGQERICFQRSGNVLSFLCGHGAIQKKVVPLSATEVPQLDELVTFIEENMGLPEKEHTLLQDALIPSSSRNYYRLDGLSEDEEREIREHYVIRDESHYSFFDKSSLYAVTNPATKETYLLPRFFDLKNFGGSNLSGKEKQQVELFHEARLVIDPEISYSENQALNDQFIKFLKNRNSTEIATQSVRAFAKFFKNPWISVEYGLNQDIKTMEQMVIRMMSLENAEELDKSYFRHRIKVALFIHLFRNGLKFPQPGYRAFDNRLFVSHKPSQGLIKVLTQNNENEVFFSWLKTRLKLCSESLPVGFGLRYVFGKNISRSNYVGTYKIRSQFCREFYHLRDRLSVVRAMLKYNKGSDREIVWDPYFVALDRSMLINTRIKQDNDKIIGFKLERCGVDPSSGARICTSNKSIPYVDFAQHLEDPSGIQIGALKKVTQSKLLQYRTGSKSDTDLLINYMEKELVPYGVSASFHLRRNFRNQNWGLSYNFVKNFDGFYNDLLAIVIRKEDI